MTNIKSMFSVDMKEALKNARADEREKCDADKKKELAELETRITGEWSLRVQALESTIESMEFRLQNHDKEKKAVAVEKQKIREVAIRQRRLVSDLVFLAQQKRDNDIKVLQDFQKLETDINNIETKLIGVEK